MTINASNMQRLTARCKYKAAWMEYRKILKRIKDEADIGHEYVDMTVRRDVGDSYMQRIRNKLDDKGFITALNNYNHYYYFSIAWWPKTDKVVASRV